MTFYCINSIDVSSEYFENEVLAINLKTGNYFSLRGTAFVFWKLITEGNSFESTITKICTHFQIEKEKASQLFEDFLNKLIQNELVQKTNTTTDSFSNEWLNMFSNEFSIPLLECYTDMQDLLLFDPIHDVDTQVGWPKKAEEDSTK